MRLEINQFGGMAPLVDPTALAENLSTFARNVRYDKGVLAPGALRLIPTSDYPDASLAGTGARAVSKLFEDGTRFAFTQAAAADAFPSPVSPADTWGRVYFMTAQGPSFATSDQYSSGALNVNPVSFRLGIPAPVSAPSIPANGVTINLGDADRVDVAYAFSFVDKYGHEGPLSPPSGRAQLAYDRTFSVRLNFPASLPTRVNFEGGARRVYRATFDGASQAWQYLIDTDISASHFIDTIPIGDEGEVAVSQTWYPAPDALKQLCLVGASFAAGFIDHYLCYSELKLPHAWPTELQFPLKYNPVKLLPMNNGLLVVTSGRPYWAEGSDPYSALPRELPLNAPCLSPDSVVDMGDVAIYATDEGFVSIGGGQAYLASQSFIDRAGMLALVDETCTAFAFDRRYVFSTKDNRWMAFSPEEGFTEYDFGFPPSQFRSVSFSVRDNRHYFALSDGRVRVVDFEGSASNVEWQSKHWRTPAESFTCLRVEADSYPVEVEVRSRYLGGEWVTTGPMSVPGPHIQRLPPGFGTLWQVRVKPPEGGRVYRVILAQTGEEAA